MLGSPRLRLLVREFSNEVTSPANGTSTSTFCFTGKSRSAGAGGTQSLPEAKFDKEAALPASLPTTTNVNQWSCKRLARQDFRQFQSVLEKLGLDGGARNVHGREIR